MGVKFFSCGDPGSGDSTALLSHLFCCIATVTPQADGSDELACCPLLLLSLSLIHTHILPFSLPPLSLSHTHTLSLYLSISLSLSLQWTHRPVGCVAKLCNNLSLAISMIGTAEAMNLVSTRENVLFSSVLLLMDCIVLYCTVLHCTVLYCILYTVPLCTMLYCDVLYCTVLYLLCHSVLRCTILVYTTLHSTERIPSYLALPYPVVSLHCPA
jgi:hypothetical protein